MYWLMKASMGSEPALVRLDDGLLQNNGIV
jgi:hypothetical protein